MKRFLVILLVTCAAIASSRAAEPSVESYKKTYDAEVKKIQDECAADLTRLLNGYGRAIDSILTASQQKGELDTVLATKKERERFDKEKSVPKESPARLPASIQNARDGYHAARQKIEAAQRSDIASLTEKYIGALDRLIRQFTRDGKLDEAVAVKGEKQRAEFILADMASQIPVSTVAQTRPKPPIVRLPLSPKPGEQMTIDLGSGVKMGFVWVPAGSFKMGSPDTERDRREVEGPVHKVILTKGFWMGKYEVTQEQYERVMGSNPSQFKDKKNPVEMVSWHDAKSFCEAMTARVGETVRLPSEAEWEYACRAGTKTRFYTGDSRKDLAKAGWCKENSEGRPHPVGQKMPNGWGLYDMHGNVVEWCWDWFGADYYGESPAADPTGPRSDKTRVRRGGNWSDWSGPRSAYRGGNPPDTTYSKQGFRVVLSASQ